jgi:hypothetical protein
MLLLAGRWSARARNAGSSLLAVLEGHTLPQQLLQIVLIIPCIVKVESAFSDWILVRFDLHLEIIAKMSFACYMCKKMADVREVGLSGTDVTAEGGIAARWKLAIHDRCRDGE